MSQTTDKPAESQDGATQTLSPVLDADTGADEEATLQLETATSGRPDEAKIEAMKRAAFDKATGRTPAKTEPDAETDAEPDGDDEPQEPPTQSSKSQPKAESKPARSDAPSTPEDRQKLVDAKTQLRYDGWTDEDFNEMSADRILKLGAKAKERHREIARALARANKQQAGDGGNPDDGYSRDQKTTGAGSQRGNQPDPLDALLDELDGTRDTGTNADKPDADGKQNNEVEELRFELLRRNVADSFKRIQQAFPQARNKTVQDRILAKMDELDPDHARSRTAESVAQLMQDAAYIELGPSLRESAKRNSRDRYQQAVDGQPDMGGTSTPTPPKRLSAEDKRRIAYETARAADPRKAYLSRVAQLTGGGTT